LLYRLFCIACLIYRLFCIACLIYRLFCIACLIYRLFCFAFLLYKLFCFACLLYKLFCLSDTIHVSLGSSCEDEGACQALSFIGCFEDIVGKFIPSLYGTARITWAVN